MGSIYVTITLGGS